MAAAAHRGRAGVAALALLLALGLAAEARAADRKSSEGARKEAARLLYESGKAHHLAGRWAEALEDYEKAYAIYPTPILRFNMAQATRLLGRSAEALSLYRAYLAERPYAPNRADVEAWIAELEAAVRAEADGGGAAGPGAGAGAATAADGPASPGPSLSPGPGDAPPSPAAVAGPPATRAPEPRRSRGGLAVALVAGGAAVLVAGAVIAGVLAAAARRPADTELGAFELGL